MKTALVTGANGFVGSAVCKELLDKGYKVRALHREGSDISTLEGFDLELFKGDIRDRDSLKSAVEGADFVFHIAALFRQAKHPDQVYRDINVEGTRNVLLEAEAAGVKRVVHCSTVGVHSHIPQPPANEEEAFRPGDIYQETKCEGEELAREFFSSSKVEGVIVRPAMIWGPGDSRTLKLFKGLSKGRMPLIGSGKTLVHWVLVSDLARAFRLAAETESANGETFIIAGERSVSMRTLFETICSCLGRRAPGLAIPALPIQVIGSIVEAVCLPFGIEPPIYRRRVDFFTKTRAFDWQKAKRILGYQPTYVFEDEVKSIANWYREKGWLA